MDQSFRARVRPQTYVLFTCLFGFPLGLCAVATLEEWSLWPAVVMGVFGLGLIYFWLYSYEIIICHGSLKYSALFQPQRTASLSEIESAEVQIGYSRYRDRLKPPIRLVVRFGEEGRNRTICINLKVFAKSDVEHVLSILNVT